MTWGGSCSAPLLKEGGRQLPWHRTRVAEESDKLLTDP